MPTYARNQHQPSCGTNLKSFDKTAVNLSEWFYNKPREYTQSVESESLDHPVKSAFPWRLHSRTLWIACAEAPPKTRFFRGTLISENRGIRMHHPGNSQRSHFSKPENVYTLSQLLYRAEALQKPLHWKALSIKSTYHIAPVDLRRGKKNSEQLNIEMREMSRRRVCAERRHRLVSTGIGIPIACLLWLLTC